jgi:hypothetical protein
MFNWGAYTQSEEKEKQEFLNLLPPAWPIQTDITSAMSISVEDTLSCTIKPLWLEGCTPGPSIELTFKFKNKELFSPLDVTIRNLEESNETHTFTLDSLYSFFGHPLISIINHNMDKIKIEIWRWYVSSTQAYHVLAQK